MSYLDNNQLLSEWMESADNQELAERAYGYYEQASLEMRLDFIKYLEVSRVLTRYRDWIEEFTNTERD